MTHQGAKLFVLLLVFGAAAGHAKFSTNLTFWNQITNHQKVFESWSKLSSYQVVDLDQLTSGMASKLDTLLEYTSNITSKCARSLVKLKKDAEKQRSWAVKGMLTQETNQNPNLALDAWGRFPPSGFMHGTFSSLGDYDTCIENDDMQYCTVHLRPLLPMRKPFENINTRIPILNKFINDKDHAISRIAQNAQLFYYTAMRVGICLPSDCSSTEVDNLLQSVASNLELKGQLIYCETSKAYESQLDVYATIAVVSFFSLISLAVIGTFFDDPKKEDKKQPSTLCSDVLAAFSIKRNFNSLFKADVHIKQFECLNGIRVFTMVWIIANHSYLWMNHFTFSNTFNVFEILNNFGLSGFLNGFFAVDSFFLISGILSTYITIKSTRGDYKNFSLFLFVISRYLRLTPGSVFSIATVFLLPYVGSGPFFGEMISSNVESCRSHWHYNLLYLQTNIVGEDFTSICNMPTWWLSAEIKLHLLSTFVVVYLFFRPRLSFLIGLLTILASIVWAFVDHMVHGFPPFPVSTIPEVDEFRKFTSDFLQRIHIHIGPFFIGLALGYVLAYELYKDIAKKYIKIGWVVSIGSILVLLYAPYVWVIGPFNPIPAALYASTCQTVWSLALFFIIFACVNGHGGFVNTFLSFKAFRPIARCIYMTYLTHGQILIYFSGTRRKLIPLEMSNLTYMLVGNVVFSFVLGFLMTLLVESPTLNLIKMLVKRSDRSYLPNDHNNNLGPKSNEVNSLKMEEI